MPIPTYDRWIEPILRVLYEQPTGVSAPAAHDAAARLLGLTDEDRAQLLPSGRQHVYKNRAGWAHDRLKRAGLSSSPRRGFWQLTPAGMEYARLHPEPLAEDETARLAEAFNQVRLTPAARTQAEQSQAASIAVTPAAAIAESPDETLERALSEIKDSVGSELLETILGATPRFFESLVLDLLHAMGYGTSRADLQRVGGVGDEGIDGIISLDRLGLEKVYVQAKRWRNSVGRPDVQAFYGALRGQRANKGVFITTSSFTAQASEFAHSIEGLVLIDGAQLASLLIEHSVGVTNRAINVPKLDSDYFEE
jgi:restriction system protein